MPTRLTKCLDWLTVWVGGTFVALLAADAVIGSYNAGISPIKPSVFTPMVFLFSITLCAFSRPRFCLPALLLLSLPVIRSLDVALLDRFHYSGSQEMLMSCLRVLMVVMSIAALLSCPQGLKAMKWAAVLTILLTSGSSIAELAGLAKFSSIPGRYSGFNGHPNSPPIVLCQCLGLCFALISSFRWNLALVAAALPGVALTYGRSGMAIYAFIAGTYILMNARRNLGFLMVCAGIALPLLASGMALMSQLTQHGGMKNKDTADRLEAIYNLDFEKLKSRERAKDLIDAWEAVMKKPVIGHGVGAASSNWAPHNEYVAMWLELGMPGLIVYLLTIYVPVLSSLLRGGTAIYAFLAILAFSPIAQGRVMDPHFYFALLTAGHLLWPQRYRFTFRQTAQTPRPAAMQHMHRTY
jgi:O-antigen ligase